MSTKDVVKDYGTPVSIALFVLYQLVMPALDKNTRSISDVLTQQGVQMERITRNQEDITKALEAIARLQEDKGRLWRAEDQRAFSQEVGKIHNDHDRRIRDLERPD